MNFFFKIQVPYFLGHETWTKSCPRTETDGQSVSIHLPNFVCKSMIKQIHLKTNNNYLFFTSTSLDIALSTLCWIQGYFCPFTPNYLAQSSKFSQTCLLFCSSTVLYSTTDNGVKQVKIIRGEYFSAFSICISLTVNNNIGLFHVDDIGWGKRKHIPPAGLCPNSHRDARDSMEGSSTTIPLTKEKSYKK